MLPVPLKRNPHAQGRAHPWGSITLQVPCAGGPQGHGWLGTGNSLAVWAKLEGSNGEKSGGCLTPPPQPCKSSPHSLEQEIAPQVAAILQPV